MVGAVCPLLFCVVLCCCLYAKVLLFMPWHVMTSRRMSNLMSIQLFSLCVLPTVTSKEKHGATAHGKKSSAGAGGGAGAGGAVLSSDNHENMRSGLASVMSTLDDMLEGMKKK